MGTQLISSRHLSTTHQNNITPPHSTCFDSFIICYSFSLSTQYVILSSFCNWKNSPVEKQDMYSCHTSAVLISPKTCLFLRRNRFFVGRSVKFRCILGPVVPEFVVSASLSSVLTSGNMIAAAAAAAGSGSVHGAVSSAITQVAVTAVAIASGACLSTKVDFLWPKADEQPGYRVLDGVEVTGYSIFDDGKVYHLYLYMFAINVQKAIAFARKAHHGQTRKTGDPYLSHCIHTGKILAALVPPSGKRAIDTVVSGILHDVIDDTCENLESIEREFGADVAKLVAGVSRLSYINQLLRRHRRMNTTQDTLSHEEANKLRAMLLGMVDDPRVVLIKLADRLHNMRTIYALPPSKAQAVAEETLAIWCSLASRLGLWALKAELEDLCFAVLQPEVFRQLRADLASMWSLNTKPGNLRRISAKSNASMQFQECEETDGLDEEYTSMKVMVLLQAVHPFDLLLDRKKRLAFFNNLATCSDTSNKPKVVRDAAVALASLVVCEEALERELFISTSYVFNKVYDARALRVIVGDKNGALHGQAVQCCYNLLNIIHRVDNDGRELLVAVSFGLAASEAVAERRSPYQLKRWEAYANLYKKVSDEWWFEPGHGDWCTCLEKYTLCRDGIYHKQDQFQRLLPTFIQVIELTEWEETEYWAVVSAVFEGKPTAPPAPNSSYEKTGLASNSAVLDTGINNKVQLLRTMLQWEEQLRSEAGLGQFGPNTKYRNVGAVSLDEVAVVCWPHGEIMRLRTGSTAADAARRIGLDGKIVSINGQLVLPATELKDGDVVEIKCNSLRMCEVASFGSIAIAQSASASLRRPRRWRWRWRICLGRFQGFHNHEFREFLLSILIKTEEVEDFATHYEDLLELFTGKVVVDGAEYVGGLLKGKVVQVHCYGERA
ncbi:Guanosine-3',5'-bis(Diphosphate) 3'-pyrophosphohydrolase [Striga asiatica]|uniref:Guanosine-3',5'-bis(Diphosphate) 3'-pyrophosphohydrolase n=1 Tax=Striga asiatica TaxID=4170 RepID=A0A5A7QZL7_STRAF|nr:Guanosine-3',5'-bis(Diphosphate) 3'-pyrophosphohydrolase [Striga asiatica]